MIETVIAEGVLSMSSLETADFTGKRHSDVLRDISAMFTALGGERSFALSSYKSEQNKDLLMAKLGKPETLCLI